MIEQRILKSDAAELRAYTEDSKMIVGGYAAKYNVESRLLAEFNKHFTEILLTGAFRERLNDDVYFTFNHSKDRIYARTINNTLFLEEDEIGLKFRAILNETTGAIDLFKMIERGDVFENSFAFIVDNNGQNWERTSNGDNIRKISRISRLIDISTVTHAAYPETEISVVRGLNDYFEEIPQEINKEPYEDMVKVLKIKNNLYKL
jgi:HK97 family phage prohead protease